MKEFFKNLSKWLTIWLWIVIMVWISYLAIKARQPTNPNLSDTTPSAVYVSNNETLSAAKRNTLASKATAPALSQQYTSKTSLTTTSTTWTDTDMTITTTTPAWHVFLSFNWAARNSQTSNCAVWFIFNIDWTDVDSSFRWNTLAVPTDNQMKTVSTTWLASVSAWVHTFKIRRKVQWWTWYLTKSNWDTNRQFQVIVLP